MLHGNRNVFEVNSSICVNAISSQQKKFTDWLKSKFYQNRRYSAIFILLEETEETENDAWSVARLRIERVLLLPQMSLRRVFVFAFVFGVFGFTLVNSWK